MFEKRSSDLPFVQNQIQALENLQTTLQTWTATPMGRRAFLASVPILLTACATGERHREREGNGVQTEMTPDDERRMTQEVLPEMQKQYPRLPNDDLQKYINNLGQNLVAQNGLNGKPYQYTFTVVDVPYVNAFALPAGTVFVTAPLIDLAENEAELAGVVGHEIGHVKAKHSAQRMEAAKKAQGKSILYGAIGGLLGGAAGYGLGKALCKEEDRACLLRASALGAAAGAGGGLLIQKFAFMANSREDEMEADRIGYKVAVQSGFDRGHAGTFYEKLLKMEESHQQNRTVIVSSVTDALATHPPSRERVAQIQQLSQQIPNRPGARVSSKEFERVKKIASQWVATRKKSS